MSTALLATLLSLALSAPPDQPQSPNVATVATLVVTRLDDTTTCGDAATLAAKVSHILNRDPFVERGAPLAFSVTTRKRGRAWEALVRLTDTTNANRPSVGLRRIRASWRTCEALDETVALALAVALDPLAALAQKPTAVRPRALRPAEAEQRIVLPRAPSEWSPTTPLPEPSLLIFTPSFGLELLVGFAPDLTIGPTLGVEAALPPLSIKVTAHLRSAVATDLGPSATTVFAPAASFSFCLVGDMLGACLGIEGAAYTASERTAATRPHVAATTSFFASVGATRLSALIGVPFGRQRLVRDGVSLWEMPAAVFGLALEWAPRPRQNAPGDDG